MQLWQIRFRRMALLVGLFVVSAGCGGQETQQMEVESVEPGAACPSGGIAVEVDGETHYICDGSDGSSPQVHTERVGADHPDNPCGTEALEVTVEPAGGGAPTVEYVCDGSSQDVDISPAGPDSECGDAGGVVIEMTDADGTPTSETICHGGETGAVDIESASECDGEGIRIRLDNDDWMTVCEGDGEIVSVKLEPTTPSHPESSCDYRGTLITFEEVDGTEETVEVCESLPEGAELIGYWSLRSQDFNDGSGPEAIRGFYPVSGAGYFTHTAFYQEPQDVGDFTGHATVDNTDFATFSGWTTKSQDFDQEAWADIRVPLEGYESPTVDVGYGLGDDGPTGARVYFVENYDAVEPDFQSIADLEVDTGDPVATNQATYDGSIEDDVISSFVVLGYDAQAADNQWAFSDVFVYAYPIGEN